MANPVIRRPAKNPNEARRKNNCIQPAINLVLFVSISLSLSSCAFFENKISSSEHASTQWKAHSLWWESIEDGDYALYVRKIDAAIAYFNKAFEKANAFGKNDPRLAKSYVSLGRAYIEKGDFAQARNNLSKGLALKENLHGKNSDQLSDTLNDLSFAEIMLHNVNEAKTLNDRAMKLKKDSKDLSGLFELNHVKALILSQSANASSTEIASNYESAIDGYSVNFNNKKMLLDTVSLRRFADCLKSYSDWLKIQKHTEKQTDINNKLKNVELCLSVFEGKSKNSN